MLSQMIHVLRGTLEEENQLSKLRGNALVLNAVSNDVKKWYEEHINREIVAYKIIEIRNWPSLSNFVTFPKPQGININMMPIAIGESLPKYLEQYHIMILKCRIPALEFGKVLYLTIHEEKVPVGKAHRRPGLHIERPGAIMDGGRWSKMGDPDYGNIAWGNGSWGHDIPVDGIYMASNVSNSCRIWPVTIEKPVEITDRYGGIEHMRPYLGEGVNLQANEMCWFSDRTPHESLPLQAPINDPNAKFVYRQFFRLVAGKISVWYAMHNTPNPLGVQPDCRISYDNKFEISSSSQCDT